MNFEKYTERARGFVQAAQNLAMREGHPQLAPGHLLKVLLDDPEGLAEVDGRCRFDSVGEEPDRPLPDGARFRIGVVE